MLLYTLKRICWLSYFIPIIITANNINIESIIFLTKNRKSFADPYEEENYNILKKLSLKYNFKLKDIKEITNYKGKVFCVEGDIACSHRDQYNSYNYFNKNHYIICLRADFSMPIIYDIYNNYVHEIIYISEYYCNDKKNLKNKYLGSPKYDYINFNKNDIYKKYNLNSKKKYILIFYPKNRNRPNTNYPTRNQILNLYNLCKENGYEILIKTRRQDKITDNQLKDKYYFEEGEHYPCVALELLAISDIAIIFSSSAIEECIYMNTPIIEIEIDNVNRLDFLKNNKIYKKITFHKLNELNNLINNLINQNNNNIFEEIKNKYFINQASKNLIL